MSHTPGPWNCDKYLNVQTPRGKLLLTGVSLTTGAHPDESEAVANTVLIAAAPDLLLALERSLGCIRGLIARNPVRDITETLAEVQFAIKKARGQ